jgi:hypothetical protein
LFDPAAPDAVPTEVPSEQSPPSVVHEYVIIHSGVNVFVGPALVSLSSCHAATCSLC